VGNVVLLLLVYSSNGYFYLLPAFLFSATHRYGVNRYAIIFNYAVIHTRSYLLISPHRWEGVPLNGIPRGGSIGYKV